MEPCEGNRKAPEKHKGGRPQKKIKRDSHVRVRITPAERLLIEDKAKEAHMNLSEWFRQAARKSKVIARLSPEDLPLIRTLTGLANNFNQLVKKAHQEGLSVVQHRCMEVLSEIDKLLKYLNRDDR